MRKQLIVQSYKLWLTPILINSTSPWISEEKWLPSWAAYKKTRVSEFNEKTLTQSDMQTKALARNTSRASQKATNKKSAISTTEQKSNNIASLKQQKKQRQRQKSDEEFRTKGITSVGGWGRRNQGREALTGISKPTRGDIIKYEFAHLITNPNVSRQDILKLTTKEAYHEFTYDQAITMVKQSPLYRDMLSAISKDVSAEVLYAEMKEGAIRYVPNGQTDQVPPYSELVSAKNRSQLFELLSFSECNAQTPPDFSQFYSSFWPHQYEYFHYYNVKESKSASAPLENLIHVQFLQRLCAKEQFVRDKKSLKMGVFINEQAIELYESVHVAELKNEDGQFLMYQEDWSPDWFAFKKKWYREKYKPQVALFVETTLPFPDIDRSAILSSTIYAPVTYGVLLNAYKSVAATFLGENDYCSLTTDQQIRIYYVYQSSQKSANGILASINPSNSRSKENACSRAIKSKSTNGELTVNEKIVIQFEDMQYYNYWSLRPNQFPSGELRKYCDKKAGVSPFQGLSQCEYWSAIYYNDFEQAFIIDRLYSSFMKINSRQNTASAIWDAISFYNTQYQDIYRQCVKPSAKKYEFKVDVTTKKQGWVFRAEKTRTNHYSYYVNPEWIPIMNEIGFMSGNYIKVIKDSEKLGNLKTTAFVTAKYIAGLNQTMKKYACNDPVVLQLETRMKSYYEATKNYAAIYGKQPETF